MPAERYFHSSHFQEGSSLYLEDQEYHHLVHVMRARNGDEIELVNGQGQLAKAHIRSIEKKRGVIQLEEITTIPLPSTQIILAQAIPRINRLEFILEKGTELGMTEIWLFPSTLSERKNFTEHQIERLNAILIAAMKQCGRLFLPKLVMKPAIKDWINIPSLAFFGDINSEAPTLGTAWKNHQDAEAALFCIGPESGFTDEEETTLKAHGVQGIKLHPNILRTDTAAIAALTLLSQYLLLNR